MSSSGSVPHLRKAPVQERSTAMVERIIVAGQVVLLRDGYARFSTNRVADEAGISPGSLYQYFSDKSAILAAVVDRHSDHLSDVLTAVLTDHFARPGVELVRATLAGLMEALSDNVEFLRLVVEQLPRAQFGNKTAELERRISDLVSAYLMINQTGARVADPAASAWILVRTVEHLAVQFVLEAPAIDREQFIDEMATLVLRYVAVAPEGRDNLT